tara:strand:- start:192 stop:560 length:369 start_codon:yes stop_codon:yes gene_type:complete
MTPDALIATYGAAWLEEDEQARLGLLERCWAKDGVYEDPSVRAKGRAALSHHIASVHATYPGARIEVTSGVQGYGQNLRFDWHMRAADGSVAIHGVDFGQIGPDGRLTRITGFFGDMPQPTG